MLKEQSLGIDFSNRTSSFRGFGGGGKVDLSSLRSLALRAPLEDLGFFPILNQIEMVTTASRQRFRIVCADSSFA